MLGEAGLVSAEDRGRERHYRLERRALAPVTAWLAGLDPAPRFEESALDGLDLEVRRTVRDRSTRTGDDEHDDTEETA